MIPIIGPICVQCQDVMTLESFLMALVPGVKQGSAVADVHRLCAMYVELAVAAVHGVTGR